MNKKPYFNDPLSTFDAFDYKTGDNFRMTAFIEYKQGDKTSGYPVVYKDKKGDFKKVFNFNLANLKTYQETLSDSAPETTFIKNFDSIIKKGLIKRN